ncbi:MAG TPA: hypothetical protein VK830_07355, partial [Xanthomonadales bacterium]|nr:hypothetical protein [Xanthomonadales bacterium]
QVSRPAVVAGGQQDSLGKFVEPVHLQIVCHQLWESLPEERETIRSEDVRAFGNVDQALALFYEQVIKSVSRQAAISQRRLRSWFDEQLITPAQTRGLVFSGEGETAGLANEVVERLNRAYLIRSEIRHGAPWYELSHDRFIGPIQRSNQEWRAARQASLVRTVIGASLVILLVVIVAGFITRQSLVTGASASALSTNVALGAAATQSAANAQTTATESAAQVRATTTRSAADARATATESAAQAQATTTQSAFQAQRP